MGSWLKRTGAVALAAALFVSGGCHSGARAAGVGPGPAAMGGAATDFAQEMDRTALAPGEIQAQLANGMVVIVKRVQSPVVSVRGYVKTGGVYEGPWLGGGLSHLLEHLVAGGSNGRRTEEQNRDLLQSIGNDSNAYTYPSHTAYFVNTTKENLDKAVDLVTGWMLTAKITPAEFDREHQVVQRELEKDNGEPDWVMYDLALRNRYRVSPAGVPTIGFQQVIRGLKRDDVYAYYRKAYEPNNMVFVVAGDLDPEQMLEAVKKYVRDFGPGRAFSHDIAAEPPVVAPRTAVGVFPKLGEAKVELGYPTVRLTDPDLYALDLLAAVLGQGDSSLLVEEIRDKGLVSDISAADDTPAYVQGTFQVDFSVDATKIRPATAAIEALLERVKSEGVSEERIKRAKVQMRAARALGLQTSEQIAESMALDYLSTGDAHFTDRYLDRIDKVTAEELKAVAAKYFAASRLLTTALVPEEVAGKDGLAGAQRLVTGGAETVASATANASKVMRYVMKDGTVLLLKRLPSSPVVSINMYALGGVTAEDASNNGIGNLAMLAATRGTKNRSADQIAAEVDELGGQLDTSSGNNTWNWSLTCLPGDLPKGLDLFADVVKNPTFPENEVKLLRQRLAAAIAMQDADWFAASMRFARKTYFGASGSPYQFMPQGQKAVVEGLTVEQVKQWYGEKILGAHRVLTIFGNIDVDKARSLAEGQFGAATAQGETTASVAPMPAGPAPGGEPTIDVREVKINPTQNPQAGVILLFDSASVVGDPYVDALTVADTMDSGYRYPTGYLFDTLRGEGLVYDVNAYVFPGSGRKTPGAFVVYAGCDPKNVDAVINGILLNVARLQAAPSVQTPGWFARSQKLITTADAMENETPAAQAQTASIYELFGLGCSFHNSFAARINKVTPGDVETVSRMKLRKCIITVTTSAPGAVGVKAGERSYSSFPPVSLTPRGVAHDSGQSR